MRRAVRIGLWILAVPSLPALLLVALVIALNTDGGRRMAERMTAQLSDGRVLLTGLAGRFPDDLRLGSLQLSDEDGRWLRAEELVLQWSPSSLLRRHVTVQQVRAARLAIDRRPRPKPDSPPPRPLPRTVDIENFQIDRVNLGAALAGTPATLTLHARASLRSIDEAAMELTAHRLDGAGRYVVQFKVGEGHVAGTLDVAEPAGGALANLLQLPGLGALQATASVDGTRGAEQLQLTATAGPLRVTASGTLDWAHRSADLALSAHSPAMTPRAGLGWSRLDVEGRWRGSFDTAEAMLTAAVVDLRGAGLSVTALDVDVRGRAGRLNVTSKASGLRIPGVHPDLLAAAPLQATAEVDLGSSPRRMTYTLTHPLAQAQGTATLATPTDASMALQLPALASIARLAGLDLAGSATLRARYLGSGAQGSFDAEGTVDVLRGTAPIPALAGHDARLLVKLAWKDGQLQIDSAHINGAAAQVAVDGGRNARQLWDLRWRASISDLAKLSAALAGDAAAEGTLRGLPSDLRADARLRADASFNGSPRGPLEATVTARGLPAQPTAEIELHGVLDASPLRLAASLRRDGAGTLRISVPRGDWKSAHVDGELDLPARATARQVPRGHLQLRIERLEDLRAFTGQELPGQLTATLESAASNSNDMALHVAVQNAQFRGYAADIRLDGHGTTREAAVDLAAQVRGLPQGELQLTSAATADFAQHSIRISALRAQYRGETLQLREAAQIHYGEVLALNHVRLALRQAQFDVDGQLSPALNLQASLRAVTPATLRPLLADTGSVDALPAEGLLSGEATLTGSVAQPQGTVQLQASGLRWRRGIAEGLPALDISARTELRGTLPATLALQLHAGSGTQLSAEGELPPSGYAALGMRVRGIADLSLANGFLEAGGRRAGGQLNFDGRIDGTFAEPNISGTVTLTNGDLQDYTIGLHLAAIGATLQAQGDVLSVTRFSARAGSGTVDGSGTIGLLQPGLPVALRMTAHAAQPISSHLVTARLDADLRLDGAWNERLRLSGRAQVSRAEITIPNALPVTVATLDVRRPGDRRAVVAPVERPLSIDVTVTAPRAVFVRGRGLDAELGGELHWGGTRTAPQISGGFELRTGRFNLAGKTLEFQSGRVSFNGQGVANQFDPTLDFVASNTSAGVTATLKVSGYADMPTLTLQSSPELPQDEVLSRLLFGTSVTQLSALQLAQMGAAVATLGGIGGGGGALLSVQRSLGLDRLAISGSGTEGAGATVEAGRYISRRVYVGTKQSTAGATQAQVEVDISQHLKVHTTFGTGTGSAQGTATTDQAGGSVGLSYEFEF